MKAQVTIQDAVVDIERMKTYDAIKKFELNNHDMLFNQQLAMDSSEESEGYKMERCDPVLMDKYKQQLTYH